MILCFTGTGNSRFAAEALAEKLEDETVSLNQKIKEADYTVAASPKPYVIVCPIYAWKIPAVVSEWIEKTEWEAGSTVYFVVTMECESGRAYSYCRNLCRKKGLNFMGLQGVAMPLNYLDSAPALPAKEVEKILNAALPVYEQIAEKIREGKTLRPDDHTRFALVMSGPVNAMFMKSVKKNAYVVSDKCNGCGKCAEGCPVNNIEIYQRRPIFSDHCIGCSACIQRCPRMAINMKNRKEDYRRYVCPDYKNFIRKIERKKG